ncbi:MAG TPA: hypothetical protein VFA90_01750 [Terriglobales bacterium]|nr:hypothetical protein [Terriglobales bacterium]
MNAPSTGVQWLDLSKVDALTTKSLPAGSISRSELRFAILLFLLLSLVTTAPYLLGWHLSFPDEVFSGILEHSFDVNNYLAYAAQAQSGKWLFHNPMTAEPHRAVFFNFEWLMIGKLARWLHISLPAATNLVRVLFIGLMTFAVYWYSSYFLYRVLFRRIALVMVMLGGGFGWITAVHLLHIPLQSSYFIDLTNANLFPFYWILELPHFLVSATFGVLGLCFFFQAEQHRSYRDYWAAGLFFVLAGTCRPYDMLYLMLATTLFLICDGLRKHSFKFISVRLLPNFICLPVLAYYYWIFKIHPVFRWWSLPGSPAPPPWLLIVGFGMTSVLLLTSIPKFLRRRLDDRALFLYSAAFTAIALSYLHLFLHFAFQFATNILIPLVMLVLLHWQDSICQLQRFPRWLVAFVLLLNSLTAFALTGNSWLLVSKGDFTVNADLLQAYAWLNTHSDASEIILADYQNSNLLPQYAHNRVFCGYYNAVNFADKSKALSSFFSANSNEGSKLKLLKQNDIHFILTSGAEAQVIYGLAKHNPISEVFHSGSIQVFYATFTRDN